MKVGVLLVEVPRSATAFLGLGLAIFSREYSVMTAVSPMAGASVMWMVFSTAALAFLVVALLYRQRPSLRITKTKGAVLALACLTALSLVLSFLGVAAESSAVFVALASFHQIGSLLLAVSWCEVLFRFGSMRVGEVFAGSMFVYALCNVCTALVKVDFALILFSAVPVFSALLLGWYCSKEGVGSGTAGDSRVVAQNSLVLTRRNPAEPKSASFLLATAVAATVFLLRFSFGAINGAWLPLQETMGASAFGQVSNLIGTIASGLYMILLLLLCWNRSTVVALEFSALLAALVCVIMLQGPLETFATLGTVPLALGQKLVLLIVMLSPFLVDARNPLSALCISFSCSMAGLGVCQGILVGLPGVSFEILALIAIGVLVPLVFYLFFLVSGRSSESAQDVIDRLEQSVFNEAERSQTGCSASVELSEALASRCLGLSRQCGLTPRESEVLLLLADRYDAQAIARMLFISEATAKTHMRKIYAKVRVHSQKELIKLLEDAR